MDVASKRPGRQVFYIERLSHYYTVNFRQKKPIAYPPLTTEYRSFVDNSSKIKASKHYSFSSPYVLHCCCARVCVCLSKFLGWWRLADLFLKMSFGSFLFLLPSMCHLVTSQRSCKWTFLSVRSFLTQQQSRTLARAAAAIQRLWARRRRSCAAALSSTIHIPPKIFA